MRFVTLPLNNLASRPARSGLTALGIAVAVGCFISIVGMSRGVQRAWTRHLTARGTHLMACRKGAVELLTTSIDAGLGPAIARVEGVADVAGELGDVMTLKDEQTSLVVGWGDGCFLWNSLQLVDGRMPPEGERDVVLLGESVAAALDVKVGDGLLLRERPFRVVGIFRMSGVMGSNSAVVPLADMQRLMEREGKVTAFHIRVEGRADPARVSEVRDRLLAAFDGLSFLETSTVAEDNLVLRFFNAVAWSVSLIAMVIALLVTLNTLLMSVLERTREIGVLTAIGWTPGRIVSMIVLEGVVLSALGGAIGLALGVAGMHALASLPRLRGLIEAEISVRQCLEVLAATLALGVLGSLYPAWRAVRLNVVDALRRE